MRAPIAAAAVVLAAAVPPITAYALGAGTGSAGPALGPGVATVELDLRYSRFSADEIRVHQGTLVRFVVTNRDPIAHELVVGGDDVHATHAEGHEAVHPPVPGEVSVGPGQRRLTTYLFDEPGVVRFACHLPGHVAYGMEGQITVVAS